MSRWKAGIVIVFAVVALISLTMSKVSAQSPYEDKHIPGFHAITQLPESMAAGSVHEMSLSFLNPNRETAQMIIRLEIVEEDSVIGCDEFFLEGSLHTLTLRPPRDSYSLDVNFVEVDGGVFQFEGSARERSSHQVILRVSSVPNLMPGTYSFTLTVTLQYEATLTL